eukprot:4709042-Pleurochrysis_carterae.AAC.10
MHCLVEVAAIDGVMKEQWNVVRDYGWSHCAKRLHTTITGMRSGCLARMDVDDACRACRVCASLYEAMARSELGCRSNGEDCESGFARSAVSVAIAAQAPPARISQRPALKRSHKRRVARRVQAEPEKLCGRPAEACRLATRTVEESASPREGRDVSVVQVRYMKRWMRQSAN